MPKLNLSRYQDILFSDFTESELSLGGEKDSTKTTELNGPEES